MKKIFWGLVLLVLFLSKVSFARDDKIYCYYTDGFYTVEHERADDPCGYNGVQIPKSVYNRINSEEEIWYKKGLAENSSDVFFSFKKRFVSETPEFKKNKNEAIEKIYLESNNEIKSFQVILDKELKQKKIIEEQKKFSELDKIYSKKCYLGNTKGTDRYNNCLLEQEKKTLAEQKKQREIEETNRKKVEAELIAKQIKLDLESKKLAEKLAKMSPDDRRVYTCSEKFGFKKGSDNFKECIFKIYSAEIELEKIELQKQLAKANSERQDRLALAQTETAKLQAYAAQQQAIAANTANSLALMETGLRMMSPPVATQPRMQTTCTYTGRFMNCF